MANLFQDPSFWVLVSSVGFVALVWKPVGRTIGTALDGKIAVIRDQIEEARALKEEAQSLLAQYQRRQREAMSEAEDIITHAEQEAQFLREESMKKLEISLERREAQAIEKIAQAEAKAAEDVRDKALELAFAAAEKLIAEKLGKKDNDRLIDEALSGVATAMK